MSCSVVRESQGREGFAEISKKISAVRWFNKTEDCIFPRSFIYDPLYNLSIFHNLSISRSDLRLQYCSYLSIFSGSTHPFCVYPRFPKGFTLYITSPLYYKTNAIKCLSHPVFMTRTVNVFTHVTGYSHPILSICRLFLVTINHYLFLSIT